MGDEVVVAVQVNGMVRARLTVAAVIADDELQRQALSDPHVAAHVAGKTLAKVVVARGRLVSIAVR
jgi:leucyl-tRNA synthetase